MDTPFFSWTAVKTLVSGRFRVMDEVDYFRMGDDPEVL
jgi:hypothetical protein